ncbi:MAG: signal peptidase I [Acidimicrobiales bacterium]
MTPDAPETTTTTSTDTAVPEGVPAPAAAPLSRPSWNWVVELAVMLVLVVAATFVLRSFVIQTFSIPSGSMLPTLQIGDRIIVDKLSYHVRRGDIVVFKRPPLEEQDYVDLVKRVIGMPGENISARGGSIYIDGKLLAEPWLPKGPQGYTEPLPGDPNPQFNLPPGGVNIPAGEYYVMGDNRIDSEDSRWFGPIPRSLIVGRAVSVVWPISQIKGL